MKILVFAFFIISLIFLLMLIVGEVLVCKNLAGLKFRCSFFVFLTGVLALYLLSTIFLAASGLFTPYKYCLLYAIFAILPFVIGKFSNYDRIKFYTNIQISTALIGILISLTHFIFLLRF